MLAEKRDAHSAMRSTGYRVERGIRTIAYDPASGCLVCVVWGSTEDAVRAWRVSESGFALVAEKLGEEP